MKADVDEALKRIGGPLGAMYAALQARGMDLDDINVIARAILPLINHAIQLDRRLSALERKVRTEAEIREPRG